MNTVQRQARAARSYGVGYLGQTHAGTVTPTDVVNELTHRGYAVEVHEPPPHDIIPPVTPTLTKSMAISVAIDEALRMLGIPHSSGHPYRCPSGVCPVPQRTWDGMITWCVDTANGYLSGLYSIPGWASSALHSGTLSGLSFLAGWTDWVQKNPWAVQWLGDGISRYGEHLTAKNVQDAIAEVQKISEGNLSKEDIPALIAALVQGGGIQPGQQNLAAQGANAAIGGNWMMYILIGLAVLMVFMVMGKR